jgi:hypothetical protein
VKKKPIKTHLAELLVTRNKGPGSTSAGVTVDAVKIKSITDFGTPDEVGDRVIAVERRKDNVLTASLVSAKAANLGDLTYYTFVYDVESGRGLKRYVAKATVTGGNLYVFTAQAKCIDFEGKDGSLLVAMVDSFQVKRQYLQ